MAKLLIFNSRANGITNRGIHSTEERGMKYNLPQFIMQSDDTETLTKILCHSSTCSNNCSNCLFNYEDWNSEKETAIKVFIVSLNQTMREKYETFIEKSEELKWH